MQVTKFQMRFLGHALNCELYLYKEKFEPREDTIWGEDRRKTLERRWSPQSCKNIGE